MADQLQAILDAVANLKANVATDIAQVQTGIDEIIALATKLANANPVDPTEVASIAADIQATADAVKASGQAVADQVARVETPPTPTP